MGLKTRLQTIRNVFLAPFCVFFRVFRDRDGGRESGIGVVHQQVVPIQAGSADRRVLVEASMWPVPVVFMQPWVEVFGSLI